MSVMASQTTVVSIAYSTVRSGVDQRKHQSSASLAFVNGIHQWPVNSPHKGQVSRKCFHLMTSFRVLSKSIELHNIWYSLKLLYFIGFDEKLCLNAVSKPPFKHRFVVLNKVYPEKAWNYDLVQTDTSRVKMFTISEDSRSENIWSAQKNCQEKITELLLVFYLWLSKFAAQCEKTLHMQRFRWLAEAVLCRI